ARKKLKERNFSKDRLNRISSPKLHRSPNKPLYFAPTEPQTSVRPRSDPWKLLASVTHRKKLFVQSVSETGYLAIPLSVLAEPCQVLFLSFTTPLDSRGLGIEIVIA